ncbi:MAG: DUF882 domain-containing protein [Desulfobulbaceae bacterium]|nr:DUF882 domain-containing protein [Desulfobulbaceae bacterium]
MRNFPILTRRRFLKNSLQLAAGIVIASPLEGFALPAAAKKHPMTFYHTHTGERLHIDYFCDGCSQSVLKKLNNFLRDFRTEEVHPIDPGLLDFLYGIQQNTGCRGEIEIISGYRSPKTNKSLRAKSSGVASKSLHMKGQALDIRLRGLKTRKLREVAVSLRKGGVGYYAKSDFVHIDTGRVRAW